MHPGLVKLARLRFRAALRQAFRGLKTVRGALLCLLGVAVFAMWLGPSLVMVAIAPVEPDTERFRSGFPLAMLGITLLYALQALAQSTRLKSGFRRSRIAGQSSGFLIGQSMTSGVVE